MLFVTHLSNTDDLDVLSIGGTVMFSNDHTVGCPAERRTEKNHFICHFKPQRLAHFI